VAICLKLRIIGRYATPPESRYKVGIFTGSTTRNAVIRFSNGSGLVEGDGSRDLRGMAVKIYIPGLQQVSGAIEPNAQDILCTNAPVHHAANIVELMDFTKAMAAGGYKKTVFLSANPSITTRLLAQTQRRTDSVLNESYWSRAPFSFGSDRTVKYVIKPLHQLPLIDNTNHSKDSWLAEDLDQQVKTRDNIVFGVYAQFQTDPIAEPIEDHAKEWTTGQVKLGELTIKKQTVDRSAKCENLVFNPWNSGIEHRPMGNMNRARKLIYEAAKSYRQERPARLN
jgi:catalase